MIRYSSSNYSSIVFMIKSNYINLLFSFTHRRFGRERSDDSVGVHLKKVGSPTNLRIRTDLHPLLAMPHLLPVKVHVSKMQNAGENFENRVLLLRSESQHLHGRQESFEVLGIGLSVDFAVSTLWMNLWLNTRCVYTLPLPVGEEIFRKFCKKKKKRPGSGKSTCQAWAIRICPSTVDRDRPTARRTRDSSFLLALAWLFYFFRGDTELSFPPQWLRWKSNWQINKNVSVNDESR